MKSFFEFGAGDESRTRDLNLGKVALYQLSYSRIVTANFLRVLPLLVLRYYWYFRTTFRYYFVRTALYFFCPAAWCSSGRAVHYTEKKLCG